MTPSNNRYRPALDGIRAISVIFTLCNHVTNIPPAVNGSVGVDVFFALSGWLITWLLLSEHAKHGTIDLKSFYLRRIFRIIPMYYIIVLSYFLLSRFTAARESEFIRSLPYFLTFCVEYRPAGFGSIFQPAWTLGIEEKFYLGWPLILLYTRTRPIPALIVSVASVTLLLSVFGATGYIIRGYAGLGLGAAMAMLVFNNAPLQQRLSDSRFAGWLLAGLILPYMGLVVFPQVYLFNIVIALFAAPTIASLWFNREQIASRALSTAVLPWLGTLTYVVYLIQGIVIRFVEAAIHKTGLGTSPWLALAVSYLLCVVLAWPLHRFVEQPMITIGRRMAARFRSNDDRMVTAFSGKPVPTFPENAASPLSKARSGRPGA